MDLDVFVVDTDAGLAITYVGRTSEIKAVRNEVHDHINKGESLSQTFFLEMAAKYSLYAAAHARDYTIDQEFIILGNSEIANINKMLVKMGLFMTANDLLGAYMAINTPMVKMIFFDSSRDDSEEHWDMLCKAAAALWRERLE